MRWELVPLICPKCGADLDVPDGIEVFRCQYCGSKCQIKASGSIRGLALIQTGVQKVALHTERAAGGIAELFAAKNADQRAQQERRKKQLSRVEEFEANHRAAKNSARACLLYGFGLLVGSPILSVELFALFRQDGGGHFGSLFRSCFGRALAWAYFSFSPTFTSIARPSPSSQNLPTGATESSWSASICEHLRHLRIVFPLPRPKTARLSRRFLL